MKKTYILITLITALLCYIYCRCSFPKYSKKDKTSKTKVSEMTELTERQKKVLESEGLPTDIDKLTDNQKRGIKNIEKSFLYLDDKYPGVEFEYYSHRPEAIMGSQMTKFVPAGYDKEDDRNIVTVERDKFENKYTDDYMCVVTRKPIENIIGKYAESYFGAGNVKTFAFVGGTDLKYGDIISEETVKGTTYASIALFIPENICSEEELQKFADVTAKWNDENQMRCSFRTTIVSENDFKEMDDSIFDNYFGKYKLINDISLIGL